MQSNSYKCFAMQSDSVKLCERSEMTLFALRPYLEVYFQTTHEIRQCQRRHFEVLEVDIKATHFS